MKKTFIIFIFFNLIFLNSSLADPTVMDPNPGSGGGIGGILSDPNSAAGISGLLGQAVDMLDLGKKGHLGLAAIYSGIAYSIPSPKNVPWIIAAGEEGLKAFAYEKAEDKTYDQCIKVSETNTCDSNLPSMSDLAKDLDLPAESPFVDANGDALNYDEAFSDMGKVHVKKDGKNVPLTSLANPSLANFSQDELDSLKKVDPKVKKLAEKLSKKNDNNMKRIANRYNKGAGKLAFKKGDDFDFSSMLNQILRKKKILDLRTKKKNNVNIDPFSNKDESKPQIFEMISHAYRVQMKKHEFLH